LFSKINSKCILVWYESVAANVLIQSSHFQPFQEFANATKPGVWWHWTCSNITKGSIQKFVLFSILVLYTNCANKIIQTRSGLQYQILKNGNGTPAKAGDEILLFETTSYRDGTVLYSNENTGRPVKVLIGGNQATDAVDVALRGMKVGEIKKIIAPPYLVKRKNYPPNVSPDSALVIKLILDKIIKSSLH